MSWVRVTSLCTAALAMLALAACSVRDTSANKATPSPAVQATPSGPVFSLVGADGQVSVRRILTPATFDKLGSSPIDDFDIDGHGRVAVANADTLYVLDATASEVQAVPLARIDGVRSVAVDGSNALLLLTKSTLSQYADGEVHTLLDLPDAASITHIAGSVDEQKIYAFGSDSADSNFSHRIVEIDPDGTVRSAVEADGTVTAVTEFKKSLYFSTAAAIYRWYDRHLQLVIRLPAGLSVTSIAAADGILYFSTADEVYGLKGLTAVSITRNLGGSVRGYNGSLYVLDTRRKFLVQLDGMQHL